MTDCLICVCVCVRVCVCARVNHLKRCKTSNLAGGTGLTLVPVPTKTARSHSDIKGRRPFDVPASIFMSIFCNGTWLTQEPPCRFQTT